MENKYKVPTFSLLVKQNISQAEMISEFNFGGLAAEENRHNLHEGVSEFLKSSYPGLTVSVWIVLNLTLTVEQVKKYKEIEDLFFSQYSAVLKTRQLDPSQIISLISDWTMVDTEVFPNNSSPFAKMHVNLHGDVAEKFLALLFEKD